jgi:hypothetical protein
MIQTNEERNAAMLSYDSAMRHLVINVSAAQYHSI